MSGREPVAAFFPSIDRNLIAELDRHLRAPAPPPAPEPVSTPPAVQPTSTGEGRPDIDGIVEAVEQAASSITAMTARIHELESKNAALEATNRDLAQRAAENARLHQIADAAAQAHNARADEAEHIAAQHVARADTLERDLATTLSDLNRVTDAIANVLGVPVTG